MLILVINPGATSTKLAVFDGEKELFRKTVDHDAAQLAAYGSIFGQFDYRRELVMNEVRAAGFELSEFSAVCGRGGPIRHIESGTYAINDSALKDAADPDLGGQHASSLGILLAGSIGREFSLPSFFTDPVSTDELRPEARYTGFNGLRRESFFHALNQKSMARKAAAQLGLAYEDANLIGLHMGGGICTVAHDHGRAVDVTDVKNEGSFSMDRGGSLPTLALVDHCFSSGLSRSELRRELTTKAGVYSYLGTKSFLEVEQRIDAGDETAAEVFRAMVYQHVKDIGAAAAALKFKVDGVFLTGGIANSKRICEAISEYVSRLAPVIVLAGEDEMRSLCEGTLRVLNGERAKTY